MIRSLCFIFIFASIGVNAQVFRAIGTWDDYLPYKNARMVAQSPSLIYCGTDVSLYSIDKSEMSPERYSKCTGLSDIGFNSIEYDQLGNQLIIAYQSSNIDIFIPPTTVINVPDIKRKNMVGDKTIYSIFIHDQLAYLGTGFGIVVLDLVKHEIKDTYYLGPEGNDLKTNGNAIAFGNIYAATDDGLYWANANSPALNNFNEWERLDTSAGLPHSSSQHVLFDGNRLFASFHDSIFSFDGNSWSLIYTHADYEIHSLNSFNGLLYALEHDPITDLGDIALIDVSNNVNILPLSEFIRNPMDVEIDEAGRMWLADIYQGLSVTQNGVGEIIYPGGPLTNHIWEIEAYKGEIYIAPGAIDGTNFTYNRDGFFVLDGNWRNFNGSSYFLLADTLLDITGTAYNPVTRKAYFSAFGGGAFESFPHIGGGLIEVDEYNVAVYKFGYVHKDPIMDNYPVCDVDVDGSGNVWYTNPTTNKPLHVLTPDGQTQSFSLPGLSQTVGVYELYVDANNRVWIMVRSEGLMVYDPGTDVLSAADDNVKRYVVGSGQGNLPSNSVFSVAMDVNGDVWVGTDKGIAVIYCGNDPITGCDAQQIIVSGTDSIAGYLLETERINDIDIDPGNRKWLATDNGVWLLSENGLDEIHHFTVDNSPLFSNAVISLAVDDSTGLVCLGTALGLQVYQSDALESVSEEKRCESIVYPNPVKHEYGGLIAIKNVPYNATVKITDAAGELVYQTKANGGMATWDGLDYKGRRASSGVYYVMSISNDGISSCRTKLVFMN